MWAPRVSRVRFAWRMVGTASVLVGRRPAALVRIARPAVARYTEIVAEAGCEVVELAVEEPVSSYAANASFATDVTSGSHVRAAVGSVAAAHSLAVAWTEQ